MTKRTMHLDSQRQATALQQRALNPTASVWISANAGTGKTEVLTYRILALLLADPALQPAQILALTFTNAAAAEMAARLTHLLHDWNNKPDADLREQLQNTLGLNVSAETLARFRQLPALAADTPPLVTTIHGFAQQMLARTPGGGGLPQRFELVEDISAHGLLATALARAVETASATEADALHALLDEFGDTAWRELSALMETEWQNVRHLLGHHSGIAPYLAHLRAQLALPEGLTLEQAAAELAPTPEEFAAWQALTPEFAANPANWLGYLFIAGGEGTPAKRGFPATKPVAEKNPAAAEVLLAAQQRVGSARDTLRALTSYNLTTSLLVWWGAVRRELEALKQSQQLKTFADLLDELEPLLAEAANDTDKGRALGQRLERDFLHLLVDEAQDNNPQQARLVQHLAQIFLSGDVGTGSRSVLAVGDPKQSIYRFQGARPQLFLQFEEFLRGWSSPASPLATVQSAHSFRSPPATLQLVESVFATPEAQTAASGGAGWAAHQTVFPHAWGRAEVWPLTPVPPEVPAPDFNVEATPRLKADGPNVLAKQLAEWLHLQISSQKIMPSSGQALQWKDILVIVQKNTSAAAMAGALNAAGVPAVAQGGKNSDSVIPVVADLTALARALGNPADRLALAQVLKSPLAGWNDAQLLQLAEAEDWWNNLTNVHPQTAAWLAHWQARAAAVPPGTWLAELAQRPEVLAAYAARGPLSAPLVQAALAGLAASAAQYASVPELLSAWEAAPPQPAATTAGAVTVLTVHRAKGLGYPLVVLAETTYAPRVKNRLAWQHSEAGDPTLLLVRRGKKLAPPLQATLDELEQQHLAADQWRGLYVALTRPKDWLVVAGWQSQKAADKAADAEDTDDDSGPNNWYNWVTQSLKSTPQQADGGWVIESGTPQTATTPPAAPPRAPAALAAPAPLQPFVWPVEEAFSPEREAALQKGSLSHRLLHALAELPPAQREAEVTRLLASWNVTDPALLATTLAVFAKHPDLFGPNSRGEVPVAVEGTEGRIDRLLVTSGTIYIVDFKTEAAPPATIPPAYRAQLARYANAISPAFPGHAIKPGILWLAANRLDWLG